MSRMCFCKCTIWTVGSFQTRRRSRKKTHKTNLVARLAHLKKRAEQQRPTCRSDEKQNKLNRFFFWEMEWLISRSSYHSETSLLDAPVRHSLFCTWTKSVEKWWRKKNTKTNTSPTNEQREKNKMEKFAVLVSNEKLFNFGNFLRNIWANERTNKHICFVSVSYTFNRRCAAGHLSLRCHSLNLFRIRDRREEILNRKTCPKVIFN